MYGAAQRAPVLQNRSGAAVVVGRIEFGNGGVRNMRLGVSTYTFGWALGVPGYPPPPSPLTVEGLLQKAADLGVRVVQLADDAQLHRLSDTELTSLRDAAGCRGIDLELGLRGIEPDWLLSHLRVAVGLRAPLVRVIIERTPHPSTADVVEALRA